MRRDEDAQGIIDHDDIFGLGRAVGSNVLKWRFDDLIRMPQVVVTHLGEQARLQGTAQRFGIVHHVFLQLEVVAGHERRRNGEGADNHEDASPNRYFVTKAHVEQVHGASRVGIALATLS